MSLSNLKLSRPTAVVITTILGAILGFADFEITTFVSAAQASAITTLLTAIVAGITLYLMTETQTPVPAAKA